MQKVTEQQIAAMAPNPAAASNGKKISAKGGFVRRECSADDTFYLGECTGSGKSNYINRTRRSVGVPAQADSSRASMGWHFYMRLRRARILVPAKFRMIF